MVQGSNAVKSQLEGNPEWGHWPIRSLLQVDEEQLCGQGLPAQLYCMQSKLHGTPDPCQPP